MPAPIYYELADINGEPRMHEHPALKRTDAERTVNVTPVNYAYPPGHVYRYGINTTPGTTDMTAAINTAADVCRAGRYRLQLPPETCQVSSTLDFSGIHVSGDHQELGPHIRATSAQFDVITSTGNSSFSDFYVDGGWDGSTAGLSGDVFSLVNSGDFAYVISFSNVSIARAKKRGIYIESGGYTSLFTVRCNACGLHGIEMVGFDTATYTTTVWIGGQSIFTSCPNGYGAKLTECAVIRFDSVIMESTGGIIVAGGGDNRLIQLNNVYQEFGHGSYFLDVGSTGGICLSVTNCFGGGKAISTIGAFWEKVYFRGNHLLDEPPVPLTGRIYEADGGELTTTTTGGVDVTAASVSLIPGVYKISATLQTVQSTASGLSQVACQITTSSGASGLNNSTNSSFNPGAAQANYSPGSQMDQRLNCYRTLTVSATTTVYLRAKLVFSGAGTLAYHGYISAERLE